MARTTLRSRSGDIVTTARIADRTGIVAASSPPVADVPEPRSGGESTLLALAGPVRQPSARRVRRKVLLAGAAAVFLVVGWIGGGTFGQQNEPTPTVAAGTTYEQNQDNAPVVPERPVTTTETPKPPATQSVSRQANQPKSVNPTTRKTASTKTTTEDSSGSASVAPRYDKTESVSTQLHSPIDEVPEDLQHLLDRYWTQHSTYKPFGR